MTFTDKIRDNILKNGLLKPDSKVLVGLSGGADSVALLLSLLALGEYTVYAAHLNHGIRGKEAEEDAEFCKKLCERHKVEFFCETADIPSLVKSRNVSLETAARDERYSFLSRIAREEGCVIATAHNANDNLETLLFNMGRGSALKGLCGIPISRFDKEGVKIIRPLLYTSRDEIEKYLDSLNQDYRTDSTNLENDATRNRLRHFVIPEFLNIFPEGLMSAARLSMLNSADEEYLSRCADTLIYRYEEKGIKAFENSHVSILSRAVKIICEKLCGRNLSEVHVRGLCDMVMSKNGFCTLPCFKVTVRNDRLVLLNENEEIPSSPLPLPAKIGEYPLWDGYFAKVSEEYTQIYSAVNKTITYEVRNCDILHREKAVFRVRNAGDRVHLIRRRIKKPLKKLLIEEKVPQDKRDRLPLLAVDENVYLLPSESFKQV